MTEIPVAQRTVNDRHPGQRAAGRDEREVFLLPLVEVDGDALRPEAAGGGERRQRGAAPAAVLGRSPQLGQEVVQRPAPAHEHVLFIA